MTPPRAPLLEIDDLKVHFHTDLGVVRAVDGVSFSIAEGETLALVGESGCGKSVTAMSILRLVAMPPGRFEGGAVRFEGTSLLDLDERAMRHIRGNDIAMIFQEPMTSLNPVFTVGDQIGESIQLHRKRSSADARREAIRMLEVVGIPAASQRVDEYPHQMSGGMRQRVMIAMALACKPRLLIADEPTTALDVTVQAQILDLLDELRARLGMGLLLITHDLGVVAEVAHRVVVMYAGLVVEHAAVEDLFDAPRHPYTAGLLESLPKLDGEEAELRPIPGNVPDALDFPDGCRFHPRCAFAMDRCRSERPPLSLRRSRTEGASHQSACFYVDEHPDVDLVAERQRIEGGG